MALTAKQLYELGAEALGWNNSTAKGKAVIKEDMTADIIGNTKGLFYGNIWRSPRN